MANVLKYNNANIVNVPGVYSGEILKLSGNQFSSDLSIFLIDLIESIFKINIFDISLEKNNISNFLKILNILFLTYLNFLT